jgi:hypothetical protein
MRLNEFDDDDNYVWTKVIFVNKIEFCKDKSEFCYITKVNFVDKSDFVMTILFSNLNFVFTK